MEKMSRVEKKLNVKIKNKFQIFNTMMTHTQHTQTLMNECKDKKKYFTINKLCVKKEIFLEFQGNKKQQKKVLKIKI